MLCKYRLAVETLAAGSMDWVHRFNPRWHVALAMHVEMYIVEEFAYACRMQSPGVRHSVVISA